MAVVLLILVTNKNKYTNISETTQKHSKYKYTYYQNTHTIVKTHTYTHITKPTYTHTYTLQNSYIHTPEHYKART